MNPTERIKSVIDAISKKLDLIEEHMAWLITSEKRFRVGQRVEWSRKGVKAGLMRRKNVKKRGTVKSVNGFSIVVKLDGLKKPTSYHHAFFNPVNGPKLF